MIIRIVRMSFHPKNVNEFLEIFNGSKTKILDFDGCKHLSLHQDLKLEHVYFTISHWDAESYLETYRNSDLFKTTWGKVKPLFNDQPVAYSLMS